MKPSGGRRLWLLFAALLVGEIAITKNALNPLFSLLENALLEHLGGWALLMAEWTAGISVFAAWCTLFGGGMIGATALAFRLARGAVTGSSRDPVIKLRDFFRRHPRLTTVMPWTPTLLMLPPFLMMAAASSRAIDHVTPFLAFAVAGALNTLMNRFGLRSLDQIRDSRAETVTTVDRDETSFQAVAVTARTQGAVFAMVSLTLAMIYGVGQSGHFWMRDFAGGLPLVGYALGAIGFAAWFRKASTIAVGRDGIFVRGTSKERFYAYQDFDEVRLAGMHFDFHKSGRRVLRLQLHGTDLARAEALADRIRAALALSASARDNGAHLLATSATGGALGRAVQGATDYRQASVSREQLWELVEGEATQAQARVVAAEALASASDGQDRARLRIAAHHVADPKVRVALEELADDELETAAPIAATRSLTGAS